MPRSNRHNPRAKVRVGGFILDNSSRNFAVDPFGFESVAVLILGVALIIRVHNHVLIPEFGFRPGGTDLERPVLKGVELPLLFPVLDLVVGDVGFQLGVPVNNPMTLVN